MLRILRWNQTDRESWYKQDWRWDHLGIFEDNGIQFVNESPDLILCANTAPPAEFSDIPAIVEDTGDAVSFSADRLNWIRPSNVVACLRNVIYRNRDYYQRPMIDDEHYGYRWASQMLTLDKHRVEPSLMTADLCRKIRLALPMFGIPHSAVYTWTHNTMPLAERPFDVGFAGRIWYEKGWPMEHRQHLASIFPSLPGKNSWSGSIYPHERLSYYDYIRHMTQCKIVLSPWGFGPWNIRDYEAILAGAVVVKPDSSGVVVVPDLYACGFGACVFHKMDFSDLATTVAMVLAKLPEYAERAAKSRKWLVDRLSVRPLINRWSRELLDSLRASRV